MNIILFDKVTGVLCGCGGCASVNVTEADIKVILTAENVIGSTESASSKNH